MDADANRLFELINKLKEERKDLYGNNKNINVINP
jgi:hypothetical protein